jgi:hypothetical protein
VLIDAGGGDNVPNNEDVDDSCGEGFYTRTDQILTHYETHSGNRHFCWDEFTTTPIDHSKKRKLSLEVLGSNGEMNAYVDDRLEANIKKSDDQYILRDELVRTMIKLHNRGDEEERGFVYHVDVQKVGFKNPVGTRTLILNSEAEEEVEWISAKIKSEVPTDCTLDITYFDASRTHRRELHDEIQTVPASDSLGVQLRLGTSQILQSPQVSDIIIGFDR